jgi:hypothetical protein
MYVGLIPRCTASSVQNRAESRMVPDPIIRSDATPRRPAIAGTILYGLNAWYTCGQQVLAALPPEFRAISGSIWIAPAPTIYALVVSLILWIVFEFLPLNRRAIVRSD